MLRICEVSSEENFNALREKEDSKYDYLYILKYNGQMVVSDNGTLVPITSKLYTEVGENTDGAMTQKAISKEISAINADLNQFLSNSRVEKDADDLSGLSKMSVAEYNKTSANLPTQNWYHIMNFEGADELFKSQLAVGMTVDRIFMRRKDAGVWQNWLEIMTSSQLQLIQGSYTPEFIIEETGSGEFTYTQQNGSFVRYGHLIFVDTMIQCAVSNLSGIESNSYLQMTLPQIEGKKYLKGLSTIAYAMNLGTTASPYDTSLEEYKLQPLIRNNNLNFYHNGSPIKPVAGNKTVLVYTIALLGDE